MIYVIRQNKVSQMLTAILLAAVSVHLSAEVVTDGTLGAAQSLAGPDFAVTADLGQQRGANLFHSFSFFNINTGESATFSGPNSVANIISRVTGGTASSIDGALNSTIPNANLFLINPGGVIFGENATLNISGSFHASTAGYLVLADGGRFDAVTPGNSVLTSAPPSAFGFFDNPAAITIENSKLLVDSGNTLSVVGGDVTMDSAILYAPGGKVQVASVQSAGEVGVDVSTLDVGSYGELGTVDVSHEGDFFSRFLPGVGIVGNIDVTDDEGGSVVIRGGRFVADSAVVFADGNTGNAGQVDIKLSDTLQASNGTLITADQFGSGTPGQMTVEARRVVLESGARLQVDNYGANTGGKLTVTATDSIEIEGRSAADLPVIGDQQSGLFAAAFGSGEGGNVSVSTKGLVIGSEGKIELNAIAGGGNAGDLSLTADTVTLHDGGTIQLDTLGTGSAGTATINTRLLEITSGGSIATKSLGAGNAGNLDISATESATLTGQGDLNPSGIYSNAFSTGNGGQIKVASADLTVTDGARIQAGVGVNPDAPGLPPATAATQAGTIELQVERLNISAAAQISTQSENAGQAGDITVQAGDAVIISSSAGPVQSGLFSTASGTGAGGNITITGGTLNMSGGAVNVSSANTGDAGSISVTAGSVSMDSGAQISTSVDGDGNGGLLRVVSSSEVKLTGQASDGFQTGLYSLTEGAGTGGAIEVSGSKVILTDTATINSESNGSGNAGNIEVTAVSKVKLKNASINTSADNADGGNIKVTAADLVELTNSEITAAVGGGEGDGGNVTIDPEFVVLSSSRILASAIGGDGGNITIVTDHFIASPDSVLDASSELGIDGTVNILSPDEEITSNLVELPAAYLDASGLLRERCSTRHQAATQSSFTVAGRNSLPTSPDSQYSLLSSVSDSFSGAGALMTRSSPAQQFMAASLAASAFGCSL
jgi:filamentous hemagglutinin family protein